MRLARSVCERVRNFTRKGRVAPISIVGSDRMASDSATMSGNRNGDSRSNMGDSQPHPCRPVRQERGHRQGNDRERKFEKAVDFQGAADGVGDPAPESAAQGETEKEARHRNAYGDGRASQHELQLLEPENLEDQGCRARCQEDRRDQNPVLQAYGVSNTITIGHWTGLPLIGRTGTANAVNIALMGRPGRVRAAAGAAAPGVSEGDPLGGLIDRQPPAGLA
ncbi:hypothetical protein ACVWY2_003911 [Bradyrhizobium sp. JR6.1]